MAGVVVERSKERDWSGIAPGAETVAAGQFAVAAVFWQATAFADVMDDPYGRGYGGGIGILFWLVVMGFALPLVAFAAGWVHSTLVSVPVMELSNAAGLRTRIPAPWWALPVLAALGAVYAAPVALLTGAPYAATWGWLAAAGVLPVVVAVHGRLRRRTKASVRRWALWTAGVAVVAAFAGGLAWPASSGAPYEPPVLARADYIGVWTGDGVRLELDARGAAMAEKLPVDDGFEVVDRCSGHGTWESREADDLHRAGVALAVPECANASLVWALAGTAQEPELFVLIGDPDGGDVRVLRKRAR